jgi:tetratricopeptide (TPR) repeat protein
MALPSKKYVLFPLLWVTLLGLAVYAARMDRSPDPQNRIMKKRLEARQDAGVKLLNLLMPSPDMYALLMQSNASATSTLPPDELMSYYEQIGKIFPWMPEGHAVLGFCHYRRGNKEKAAELFQKACALDPQFFWPCRNLAVIALEAGQYAAAEQLLSLALNADPRYTLEKIMTSKAYRDILTGDPSYNPAVGLQEIYAKDLQTLGLLKNKTVPSASALHVRIF